MYKIILLDVDASETGQPLLTSISLDFFALFGAGIYGIDDGTLALRTQGFLVDGLKERKGGEMGAHPVMQVLDIGDGVDDATGAEDIGVLGKQGGGDDTGLVLPGFEVGIGEEEEEGGEGVLGKVVGQELHGICADDGDILVGAVGGDAQGRDAVLDILGDLDADLET